MALPQALHPGKVLPDPHCQYRQRCTGAPRTRSEPSL